MSDINSKKISVSKSAALAKCALFTVLMVVSAFVSIPFPPVPLTFQTVVAVAAG